MNRPLAFLLASGVAVVLLVVSLRGPADPIITASGPLAAGAAGGGDQPAVLVFCAASNRAVMEAVRSEYEQQFPVRIQVQYGPSQTLLSSMEVSGTGDLYLPADDSYLEMARQKQLVDDVLPLATMKLVVAVSKDNPRGIDQFSDLLREDIRVVQANYEATAVGQKTRDILTRQGLWQRLDQRTTAYRTTVTDVANDVKVGAADAAIVFDAVLHTYPELQAIELPELVDGVASVAVGVIASTRQPARAYHFARFLSARDRGLKHYRDFGFEPVAGDAWADSPEITIYAGSMLRPAIESTLEQFELREGAKITRVYNGCGILVAQMKAGETPDIYFACDVEFMKQVEDLFLDPIEISKNELVILVQKGNPHQIASLRDLSRPGLRVGIGHEKQCAMGWLTQRTLEEGGVQSEVMNNVTVESPTGDMLVNQLKAGSLDAAVAYLSNAAGSGEVLDAIRIKDIPCSQALQPLAVAPNSAHKQLIQRLYGRLTGAQSQMRFLEEGFGWQLSSEGPRDVLRPSQGMAP